MSRTSSRTGGNKTVIDSFFVRVSKTRKPSRLVKQGFVARDSLILFCRIYLIAGSKAEQFLTTNKAGVTTYMLSMVSTRASLLCWTDLDTERLPFFTACWLFLCR